MRVLLAFTVLQTVWGYVTVSNRLYTTQLKDVTDHVVPSSVSLPDVISTATYDEHLLTMSFPKLTEALGGSGRARMFWDHLRIGQNPLNPLERISQEENDIHEDIKMKQSTQLPSLSDRVKSNVESLLNNKPLVSTTVLKESLSSCGTNKLLLGLKDGYTIESGKTRYSVYSV